MAFILHIGRHKTGTSALQRFLFRNRRQLERRGFYYPRSGMEALAHHVVARHFVRPSPASDEAIRELLAETASRSETAVLSSEAFQNCNPARVEEVFRAGDTRIVVYLREQAAYLVSAYQQRVHASAYCGSLEEFAQEFVVDYDAFLHRWEQTYGRDRVLARLYGPGLLKDGDIVADFCATVGLARGANLIHPPTDRNPSIGGALLEFKRVVNTLLPDPKTAPPLYRALSDFVAHDAGRRVRPHLAPQRVAAVRVAAQASNERVFARYPSLAMGFGVEAEPAATRPMQVMEPASIVAVAEAFAQGHSEEYAVLLQALHRQGHAVPQDGPADWGALIERAALAPNLYPVLGDGTASDSSAAPSVVEGRSAPPADWDDEERSGANRAYVQSLFEAVLRRAPRSGELMHWMRVIETDHDARELPALLMASREFERSARRQAPDPQADSAYVQALFEGVLRRPPRETELAHWLGVLQRGVDPRLLPPRLLAGKEFQRRAASAAQTNESNADFVELQFQALLQRSPREAERAHWLHRLDNGLDPRRLAAELAASAEHHRVRARLASLFVPPGHRYSPIVDVEEVRGRIAAPSPDAIVAGVAIDGGAMLRLWGELVPLLRELPFPQAPDPAWRYHLGHSGFGIGDAGILHALLRRHPPRRIVQAGAGPSTACALDTIEKFLGGEVELAVVEPRRDESLRRMFDATPGQRVTLHECRLQDTDRQTFAALEAGDMLMLNSTHVLKTGSDVAHMLFEVLPALREGVWVHIQSVFWPFEYGAKWIVDDNRSWNEVYALRAFLMYNATFEVAFFNDYFARRFRAEVSAQVPAMLGNPGAGIWLRKTSAASESPPESSPGATRRAPAPARDST